MWGFARDIPDGTASSPRIERENRSWQYQHKRVSRVIRWRTFVPALRSEVTGSGSRITVSAAGIKCCVLRLQWKGMDPSRLDVGDLAGPPEYKRFSGTPENPAHSFFPLQSIYVIPHYRAMRREWHRTKSDFAAHARNRS